MQWKRSTITPGQRYGRLAVVEEDPIRYRASIRWVCQCDCGNTTSVISTSLRNGKARSCGCGVRAALVARNTRHGGATRSGRVPEYKAWCNIKRRCQVPGSQDYAYYGGRGIMLCAAWQDFATFYRDMGPRPSPDHSIDRIDNNGPYSPDNCRWATRVEQGRNKRSNIWLTHDGQTLTLAEWSRRLNLPYDRLLMRLRRGWSVADTLS